MMVVGFSGLRPRVESHPYSEKIRIKNMPSTFRKENPKKIYFLAFSFVFIICITLALKFRSGYSPDEIYYYNVIKNDELEKFKIIHRDNPSILSMRLKIGSYPTKEPVTNIASMMRSRKIVIYMCDEGADFLATGRNDTNALFQIVTYDPEAPDDYFLRVASKSDLSHVSSVLGVDIFQYLRTTGHDRFLKLLEAMDGHEY